MRTAAVAPRTSWYVFDEEDVREGVAEQSHTEAATTCRWDCACQHGCGAFVIYAMDRNEPSILWLAWSVSFEEDDNIHCRGLESLEEIDQLPESVGGRMGRFIAAWLEAGLRTRLRAMFTDAC